MMEHGCCLCSQQPEFLQLNKKRLVPGLINFGSQSVKTRN